MCCNTQPKYTCLGRNCNSLSFILLNGIDVFRFRKKNQTHIFLPCMQRLGIYFYSFSNIRLYRQIYGPSRRRDIIQPSHGLFLSTKITVIFTSYVSFKYFLKCVLVLQLFYDMEFHFGFGPWFLACRRHFFVLDIC